ncbi:hypothetical protein V2J09_005196 [Rumex salicifolius]
MDSQDGFSANLFKWDPRASSVNPALPPSYRILEPGPAAAAAAPPPAAASYAYGGGMLMSHHHHHHHQYMRAAGQPQPQQQPQPQGQGQQLGGLEELFQAYGIRYYTASKIAEMGFTANTLVDMREEELDDMINSLSHIFRWDLLVGEKYGIKAAVRAERRRLQELEYSTRHVGSGLSLMSADTTSHPLDAFSQEGISEERVVQGEKEVVRANWEMLAMQQQQQQVQQQHHERKKQKQQKRSKKMMMMGMNNGDDDEDELDDNEEEEDNEEGGGGGRCIISERQREHPFIVTEPGEVARGKKNGLDYLFHLYELCHDFLIQVQNLAKDCGDKCPTKMVGAGGMVQVTNQVFRYAKKAGATYINKPKMRHYVHCYALHCLDEETSHALRRAFKERGETVGAWRQACYKPLVAIAARQGSWDIDAIFNAHPRLSIWYVPTKLRQLCHAERSAATAATTTHLQLPF